MPALETVHDRRRQGPRDIGVPAVRSRRPCPTCTCGRSQFDAERVILYRMCTAQPRCAASRQRTDISQLRLEHPGHVASGDEKGLRWGVDQLV
eukprot:9945309-Lingulodinium_polyedra.AAC.1